MKIKKIYLIIIYLTFIAFNTISYGKKLVPYFNELFNKYYDQILKFEINDYYNFSIINGLKKENLQNKKKYTQLIFFHKLFTGNSLQDFSQSGILNIPYVWHWTKKNPRFQIIYNKSKQKLNKVPSPKRFKRYPSLGHVDRLPVIFLSDLASEKPNYYHKKCGKFYTFGWCSEREMSFITLLSFSGFEAEIFIHKGGSHASSMFLVDFIDNNNEKKWIYINIDNTFDRFQVLNRSKNKQELIDWIDKKNTKSQYYWMYYRVIHSQKHQNYVKNIKILKKARERIENNVKFYYGFNDLLSLFIF